MGLLEHIAKSRGNIGWPWTEEVDPLIYQNTTWPKITIVTPSYNQGKYIEETIRSILLQNYLNLEYIIIDGGSTDETVSIIKKYEPWITHWISEKDSGQAEAINKGLKIATGDIFNWLNSDDYLTPGALHFIADQYKSGFDILAGCVNNFDDAGNHKTGDYIGIIKNSNLSLKDYFRKGTFYFHQPAVWLKKQLLHSHLLNEKLHYCFDTEFILNLLEGNPNIVYTDTVLVNFRLHGDSKTVTVLNKFLQEFDQILQKYTTHENAEIAADAKRYADNKRWREFLNQLPQQTIPKLQKTKLLLTGIIKKPYRRFNRFTIGALRKVLWS